MDLAPWREPLARALHRHRRQPSARYLQLATVTPQGLPANRTVVFRGFGPGPNQLKIATDCRSDKFSHLQRLPQAEACWYFPKTREQFRLRGAVALVQSEGASLQLAQERRLTWQGLSETARRQFAGAPPGRPQSEERPDGIPPPVSATDPLPNFGLLLLAPQEVDHLQLGPTPHQRWLYRLDGGLAWQAVRLNP